MDLALHIQVYPPPPYSNGQFSNGPPYIARAAQLLAEPLQDYAVGEHCVSVVAPDTHLSQLSGAWF